MNITRNINKLLYALKVKRRIYKINSFQFYSEKNNKYSTKYQVLKRKIVEYYNVESEELECKEKYVQDYDCYNRIDLMRYLAEELKGSEASGK